MAKMDYTLCVTLGRISGQTSDVSFDSITVITWLEADIWIGPQNHCFQTFLHKLNARLQWMSAKKHIQNSNILFVSSVKDWNKV